MNDITPANFAANFDRLVAAMLTPARVARFRAVAAHRLGCLTAALEDLYDPRNVSAAIRTCEVFGCAAVHVIAAADYEATHGIARAADRWLTVQRHGDLAAAVAHLRAAGYTIVGTRPAGDAVPFTEFPLPPRLCVLMGREHDGLSAAAQTQCDAFVTIPMFGFTQSLNISCALAILLQHFAEAYRRSGRDVGLPAAAQAELLRAWCERDLRLKLGWA
jgi:tRNA (guanosine-2'-O-)-methyltransferase